MATQTLSVLSREQALTLVIEGMNGIRDGILAYHDLGLTLTDLYADLLAAGWAKSKRTLQRVAADLRSEGLLPETTQGTRTDLQRAARSDSVSHPVEPVVEVTEMSLPVPQPTLGSDYPKLDAAIMAALSPVIRDPLPSDIPADMKGIEGDWIVVNPDTPRGGSSDALRFSGPNNVLYAKGCALRDAFSQFLGDCFKPGVLTDSQWLELYQGFKPDMELMRIRSEKLRKRAAIGSLENAMDVEAIAEFRGNHAALAAEQAEANGAVDDAIEAAIAKARVELPPEEFQAAMEQLGRVA